MEKMFRSAMQYIIVQFWYLSFYRDVEDGDNDLIETYKYNRIMIFYKVADDKLCAL